MAAPEYTTDLIIFNDCSVTTDWVEMTGMAVGGGATADTDLGIYGSVCISELIRKTGLASLAYDNGAGVTIPTDGGFFVWSKYQAPNGVEVRASGGVTVVVGSSVTVWGTYNMDGSDTYPYGGWTNYFVDPTIAPDIDNGGYTTTYQFCGTGINVTNVVSKGNPQSIDIIRYGRGEARFTDGDLANGYATFDGYALVNDNATTGRFGLFQDVGGSYLWKGLMSLGYTTASVDFRDSNVNITIDDTFKASPSFNKIEIHHSASRIEWTGINITSLSSESRGNFEVVDDAAVNITGSVFTDMGTFKFQSTSSLNTTTFRRTDQIVQSGSTFELCVIEGSVNSSSMLSDLPSSISNTTFTYGMGHALEITETGSFTFSGNVFNNYLANDTSGSALYNNSGGPVTMSIVNASSPTFRNGEGSTTLISADVAITLTGMIDNTEIRVFDNATSNPQVELAGVENATDGTTNDRSFTFSLGASEVVDIVIVNVTYENQRIDEYTIPGSATSIPIQQTFDRNYDNP